VRSTGRRLPTALDEIVQADNEEEDGKDEACYLTTRVSTRAADPMSRDQL